MLLDFHRNLIAVDDARALGGNRGYDIVVTARRRSGQLIMTDAVIDGVRTDVVIDTGAQGTIGNLALHKAMARRMERGQASLYSVTGQQVLADVAVARRLPWAISTSTTYHRLHRCAAIRRARPQPQARAAARHARAARFRRVAIDFPTRKVLFRPAGAGKGMTADARRPRHSGRLATAPVAPAGARDRRRHRRGCGQFRNRARPRRPPAPDDRAGADRQHGPFDFVIDTGSQTTVVAAVVAGRLALPPGRDRADRRHGRQVRGADRLVDEIRLGSRSFYGLTAPMLQDQHIGADGILGTDSLQHQRVLLDFNRNYMAIGDASTLGGNSGYEIVVTARRKSGQLIMTNADDRRHPYRSGDRHRLRHLGRQPCAATRARPRAGARPADHADQR